MVWVEGHTPYSTERNCYLIGNVGVGKGGQKRITGTLQFLARALKFDYKGLYLDYLVFHL